MYALTKDRWVRGVMMKRRKKNYDSVELLPMSDGLRTEPSDVNSSHARKIAELGEGMIAYYKSEKKTCSRLLDLLETCHRHSERHQEMIDKARGLLGRIDGLLASLALKRNVTRH